MNKRGESTTGFLIPLVLGLILLAVVAFIILNIGNKAEGAVDTFDPGELDLKTTACQITATTKSSFCKFDDVGEKKNTLFINCEYTGINFDIGEAKGKFDCDDGTELDFCTEKVLPENWGKVKVNDELCSSLKAPDGSE